MKNVLVVDDTKNIRTLLTKCLELEGYTVDTAIDGQHALELVDIKIYDLIFMDIKMPHLSGTEVLRRLREAGIDTPVVIITAYATIKNAVECTQMGAVAYLQKPFTADKVRSVLEEINCKRDEESYFENMMSSIDKLIKDNKLDEALEYAKKVLSIKPNNSQIYFFLSKIYEGKNDKQLSEKYMSISNMFIE